jgi:hypothetical protein
VGLSSEDSVRLPDVEELTIGCKVGMDSRTVDTASMLFSATERLRSKKGAGGRSALLNRLLLPIVAFVALIAAIETLLWMRFNPNLVERSGWLLHDPYKGEPFDRVEVREKLRNLEDSEPDIISVGDSSGFFSIQPTIVNRYTHGLKYVNLSTGANHAYDGYRAMAEYILQRSHHIKYVVLYVYPGLLPADGVIAAADLGSILFNNLISIRSFAAPPSAAFSPYAKTEFFEHRAHHASDPLTNHAGALQFISTARQTLGWLPEFDIRFSRLTGKIGFYPDERQAWYYQLGLTERSSINAIFSDFKSMVSSYGAQLVIAFAPFPRSALLPVDPNITKAEEQLARFQQNNPDVKFLFPLVTTFGSEKFGMYNHISREYTFLSSERIGRALGRLIEDPDSIPPYTAQFKGERSPKVSYRGNGAADARNLGVALAFYLYANTADRKYWDLLSKRVRDELEQDQAFGYMMEDAKARIADLKARGIDLTYDISRLTAKPVEMTGMVHCDSRDDIQWYQISGVMDFGYSSSVAKSTEPVSWPESSEIFIPTVFEDGMRKFDGFCSEPSLSTASQ